jgi:hypothetical protein
MVDCIGNVNTHPSSGLPLASPSGASVAESVFS